MESMPTGQEATILIVDDETAVLTSLHAALLSAGLPEPALCSEPGRVLEILREQPIRLLLLDLIMPGTHGLEILEKVKQQLPLVECVIVTAIDDIATAVQAVKLGAFDYLTKPVNLERLFITIRNGLERATLKSERSLFDRPQSFSDLRHPEAFAPIIARDPAMARVFHQVEALAPTDYGLLLSGESGTGKELIARAVHRLSSRAGRPFVAVNMAACSNSLFEAEFFGHEKGAFTGATTNRQGFFESANHGTLFLDEIGELDATLQAKLLRVLQEGELYRLGSTTPRQIDVRVVTATNRELGAAIDHGKFRADLYYRLATSSIHLPPLRQRPGDILLLAEHFLREHARRSGKPLRPLASEAMAALAAYHFPGNVRELENAMAAAVLLEQTKTISLATLGQTLPLPSRANRTGRPATDPAPLTLEAMEKSHILSILEQCGGNRTRAAQVLQIGLRTLQRKLKKYGL